MPPCSIPSRIGGDVKKGLITFKSGEITGQTPYPTHLDFAALEELTRTITAGTYANGYKVFVLTSGGDVAYSDLCQNCGLQEYQDGKVMVVFRTDEDVTITKYVEASGGAESPRTTNDRMRYMGRGGGPGAV